MTREDEILQRLDRLEDMLRPLSASAASMQELRAELTPRVNEGVKALIMELAEIEGDVQLEDLLAMLKKLARATSSISKSLEYLNSALDFIATAEPLMRITVPHAVEQFDQLERDNVFRLLWALINVMQAVGRGYTEERIEKLEQGLPRMVAITEKLLDPAALRFLECTAAAPLCVDYEQAKAASLGTLFKAMRDKRTQQGMAVLLQMARAMAPESQEKAQ